MDLTKDKYISFFIENFQDIEALLEIYNHAKSYIPTLLDREMIRCLDEIDFDDLEVHYDEGIAWWCDPELYDEETFKGPYFGYESNWNSLFTGNDPEDASFLYLYLDAGKLKQKSMKQIYIDKWVDLVKKESNSLKKQNIRVINPVNYDDSYLLKYSLYKEVNMATLVERERLNEIIRKAIKGFTESCLPILMKAKEINWA